MLNVTRFLNLLILFISVAINSLFLIFLVIGGLIGLVDSGANPVFKKIFGTPVGIINFFLYLSIAILAIITLRKFKNNESSYLIYAFLTFGGGFLATTLYRLVFITSWKLERIDLNNLVMLIPLLPIVLYNYLDRGNKV